MEESTQQKNSAELPKEQKQISAPQKHVRYSLVALAGVGILICAILLGAILYVQENKFTHIPGEFGPNTKYLPSVPPVPGDLRADQRLPDDIQ